MNDMPATHVFWYPGHELLVRDIVRAENCYLYDRQGKRYVDLESGVWCTTIGHGHPRIQRLIAEQSARICHTGFNYSHPLVEAAALEVLSLLDFEGGKCVFLCSGSEAVEYGVRVAQSLVSRPLLLTLSDSYFGAYGSAHRKQKEEWFSFDWMPCADCSDGDDCGADCPRWSTIPFDQIGGFLFEPGSSSGLVRFPPVKLIRAIVRTVRENQGLILVNEVTTGIGRTGTWFGFQHYDLTPDIVAMGKGIGNGYPVSVAAFARAVIDRLGDTVIRYAQSHQNDPLGAAIAREVIWTIREGDLIQRGRELGAALGVGLERVRERTGRIKQTRARGLMVALELDDDAGTPITTRVHRELVHCGYVVGRRPGVPVLRLDPSLTVGKEDLDHFLQALAAVLGGTGSDPKPPASRSAEIPL